MKRILPVAITLLAFGTVLSCDRQDNRWVNAFEALPTPGTPVPAFDAPLLHAGGRVSKDSLLGSPAVIALWSTTCYGSRQSIAALQNLFNTYEPRGVRFLILAADENLDHLTQFVDSARLDIPVAHSPDLSAFDFSDQAPDTDEYRVMFALPSFLVVGAHGTVVARSGGMLADSVLVGALDSLTANARGKNSGTAFTPLARQPQYRWERLTEHAVTGGTPIVFDDRLWLVGVNRNRGFSPGLLVSDDGVTWREQTAPWNPRGAVRSDGWRGPLDDGRQVFHGRRWRNDLRLPQRRVAHASRFRFVTESEMSHVNRRVLRERHRLTAGSIEFAIAAGLRNEAIR